MNNYFMQICQANLIDLFLIDLCDTDLPKNPSSAELCTSYDPRNLDEYNNYGRVFRSISRCTSQSEKLF